MKQWMALNLLIPQEFQEAISNFLMEQGANGLEEIEESSKGVRLKAYFPKDGKEKRIFHALSRYLKSLEDVFLRRFLIRWKRLSFRNRIGGRIGRNFLSLFRSDQGLSCFLPGRKVRLKKGQIPIEITPGMAFGTGTHATTQLCIQALETRLKKGSSVLDVGTGSGILAIVAAKLGAQEVWGIDIDQVAVEGARENVEKNGVSGIVRIRKGRSRKDSEKVRYRDCQYRF